MLTGKKKEVVEFIVNRITKNNLSAGKKLDSESGIAKALGITRATVREATRYLVEKGIIYRVNGSGLYVGSRDRTSEHNFHVLSPFDKQANQAGQRAIRKVLSNAIIEVPSIPIAQALRIKPSEKVYYVERLMSFGDMPVSFEKIHMPVYISDSFEFGKLETSKYCYMEQLTGKKVQLREQDISAFNLNDAALSELLRVDVGQAMIELKELVSFDDGMPFEYTITTINSALFNIHQVIHR